MTFRRDGAAIHALRGISLDIEAGEIVGVVGESGSGKSVLGLSLLGLLPQSPAPDVAGRATVAGVDMVRAAAEELRAVRRRELGAVFQDPMTSLNPSMRIGEQIAEAAGSAVESLRLLEAVGFPDPPRRLRAYPHELSGGLRQRVMIAMALAGSPSLIVADEPTTALDVTVQAQILRLIARLRDEFGTSFLFITHDLGVAAQIADRIAVVYGGRLAESGTTADLLRAPAHPYTAGLLRARMTMRTPRGRPIVSLPGEPPDPRAPPPGCPFAPRCELATPECEDAIPPTLPRPDGSGEVACLCAGQASGALDPAAAGMDAAATGAAAAPALLRIDHLSKTFKIRHGLRLRRERLPALREISLELFEGEALAIVGESGSGKSTLLRVVAGLMAPDAPAVELASGRRTQMVFQDAGASLTPWLRIGEQVGEALTGADRRSPRARAERVARALQGMGLATEVARAKPAQLSGGQLQRAALARATVEPPALLLCDEPTSALDVSLAATVLNMLQELRRRLDTALMFVTHDLAIARLVADRIAVMYLGRVVEIGPAEAVVAEPAHPYTAILLESLPDLDAELPVIEGEPASPLDIPKGCAFQPRCPAASERCRTEDPALVSFAEDREVACWHPRGDRQ